MLLVDTNVLVYAHREDSPWHAVAARALSGLAQGGAPWSIPWPCVHEFFSIVTHPKVFSPPTPPKAAMAQIDAWLESPTVVLLAESGAHWATLRALLNTAKTAGPQVHDARIAALCLQHSVRELWSADRDFQKFPALRTRNPLLAASQS